MRSIGVGGIMKNITDRLKSNADADMKKHGLTFTQSMVLGFLHSKGGDSTQKEIEEYLNVSHPTVVGIVSRMEQNGFVTTQLDTKVHRSKLVQLTEKASVIGEEMTATIMKQESTMLRGISEEETAQLIRMLNIIYNNIK